MADSIQILDATPWQTPVFSGWWVRLGNYRHDPVHELDVPDFVVADFMPTADGGTDFLLVALDRPPSAADAADRLISAIQAPANG